MLMVIFVGEWMDDACNGWGVCFSQSDEIVYGAIADINIHHNGPIITTTNNNNNNNSSITNNNNNNGNTSATNISTLTRPSKILLYEGEFVNGQRSGQVCVY